MSDTKTKEPKEPRESDKRTLTVAHQAIMAYDTLKQFQTFESARLKEIFKAGYAKGFELAAESFLRNPINYQEMIEAALSWQHVAKNMGIGKEI
jgi:hypothetical protein